MLRIITGLLLAGLTLSPASATDPSDAEVMAWIDSLGGSYAQNETGEITGVDLHGAWVTDFSLQKLSLLPKLQRVDLSYTKITDVALEQLAPLENVQSLNLHYAEYVTDVGIAYLKHWKTLEHLNVRGTKVTSTLFEHVSGMTRLKSLDVGHSRVSDELFENLVHLEQLKRFSFGGNKMSGASLPLLKLLPALQELRVGGRQRTDSGLWGVSVTDFNIDNIARLDQLEVLDLSETDVTDAGVAKLARINNLRTLDLSGTGVAAKGIEALAALPDLRHLKLWQAEGIGDDAVPGLVQLKKLQVLELQQTNVTFEGLKMLSGNNSLTKLFIGGVDLTEEQLQELRAALPDCFVSWWHEPQVEYESRSRRSDN